MDSTTILYDVLNGVARITLNRPQVYNSFNQEMSKAAHAALDAAAADSSVRVIYLTGAGKGFCAGQDLAEAIDPNSPDIKRIVEEHYNPLITRMRTIEKPVVVGVNGVAAGAGANVALAGDIVVARKSANFVQAFIGIGLIPDSGGTFILPRLIGWQKAAALMMLGEKIDAVRAEQMGMIYQWFEDEAFEEQVHALCAKLASMPTTGIGLTKRLLNASLSNNLEQQLQLEGDVQLLAAATNDFREGVQAFLEKRKPVFKGN